MTGRARHLCCAALCQTRHPEEAAPVLGDLESLLGPSQFPKRHNEYPSLIEVRLEIQAHTLNGTYGGETVLSDIYRTVVEDGRSQDDDIVIYVITMISAVSLVGLGGYLFYTFRLRGDRKGD